MSVPTFDAASAVLLVGDSGVRSILLRELQLIDSSPVLLDPRDSRAWSASGTLKLEQPGFDDFVAALSRTTLPPRSWRRIHARMAKRTARALMQETQRLRRETVARLVAAGATRYGARALAIMQHPRIKRSP